MLVAYEEWQVLQQWQQKELSRSTTDNDESANVSGKLSLRIEQSANTQKAVDQVAELDQTNLGAAEHGSVPSEESTERNQ